MKLEKWVIDRRRVRMEADGVEFLTGVCVGKDVTPKQLEEQYDAVILACGAPVPRDLPVPGREGKGIGFAVPYLTASTKSLLDGIKLDPFMNAKGKRVLVIGGGDTANDCIGTAVRQGAKKITQFLRREEEPLTRAADNPWPEPPVVRKDGYGQQECVAVYGKDPRSYATRVKEFVLDEGGKVKAAIGIKLERVIDEATGKKITRDIEGSEFEVKCDMVLIAAGFTGADLENLLNEASIVAAKENRTYIIQKDIEKAFIKVGLGVEKKSRVISDKEKRITAFHEAGHAILFHVLPDVDPVHMISIIPTGLGAAGYTMPLPEKDEMFLTKSHMLQDIMVSLGGRIAEEIVFNDITTGASNDIQKATKTARNMVTRYGMSEKLGVINYENDEDEVFIGRDLAHAKSHSELISGKIDTEVKDIVDDCYRKAKEIILEHMDVLNRCAELLLVKEKIGREEFEALFDSREICKQDNHVMEN